MTRNGEKKLYKFWAKEFEKSDKEIKRDEERKKKKRRKKMRKDKVMGGTSVFRAGKMSLPIWCLSLSSIIYSLILFHFSRSSFSVDIYPKVTKGREK